MIIIEHVILGFLLLGGASYHQQSGSDERKHEVTKRSESRLIDKHRESMLQCSRACGPGRLLNYSSIHGSCTCTK